MTLFTKVGRGNLNPMNWINCWHLNPWPDCPSFRVLFSLASLPALAKHDFEIIIANETNNNMFCWGCFYQSVKIPHWSILFESVKARNNQYDMKGNCISLSNVHIDGRRKSK